MFIAKSKTATVFLSEVAVLALATGALLYQARASAARQEARNAERIRQEQDALNRLAEMQAKVRERFKQERQELMERMKKLEAEERETLAKLEAQRGELLRQ